MSLPPLVLAPHPGGYLASPTALAEYLRDQGVRYRVRHDSIAISVHTTGGSSMVIDVYWLEQLVTFIAHPGLATGDANPAELALAVERLNVAIGFPVWRILPTLAATYTVALDHTGALSTRIVELGIALLRETLSRDEATLREVPGVQLP